MENKHTITSKDRWFLETNRKDPVAQEPFKVGDTIVICAKCKTVYYDSSWSMNSNKCCTMGCNHSKQLSFSKFSPLIFQPKITRSSGFHIIVDEVPLVERLKLFNGYPLANLITAFLPILVIARLYYAIQILGLPASDNLEIMGSVQTRVSNVCDSNSVKLKDIAVKVKGIEVRVDNMDYKISAIESSFDGIDINVSNTNVREKLSGTLSNIEDTSEHAWSKISRFFCSSAEFISKILGG